MKLIKCTQCGGNEFSHEGGYMICKYCNARFVAEKGDYCTKPSNIALSSDIDALLNKCKLDPRNARRYANLILDIDPDNPDALKYL